MHNAIRFVNNFFTCSTSFALSNSKLPKLIFHLFCQDILRGYESQIFLYVHISYSKFPQNLLKKKKKNFVQFNTVRERAIMENTKSRDHIWNVRSFSRILPKAELLISPSEVLTLGELLPSGVVNEKS